jgi:hypothetical protein
VIAGYPRTGAQKQGTLGGEKMKKTIATLVAVTILSLGAAFAQEAKTETKA